MLPILMTKRCNQIIVTIIIIIIIITVIIIIAKYSPDSLPEDKLNSITLSTGKEVYHDKDTIKKMYPLMIITNGGTTYKFKKSETDTIKQFNNVEGLGTFFDWSKSVCHMTVWSELLLEMYTNGKKAHWKQNAKTQKQNIKATISNLSEIERMLNSISNKKVAKTSTNDIPVKLKSPPSAYISHAKQILLETYKFVDKILQKNSITDKDVQDLMNNIMNAASWLFNATTYPIQHRTINTLKAWQCAVSKEFWNKLTVVIATGMPETSGLGQTRGNCLNGGTSEATMRLFMNEYNFNTRVLITPSNSTTFDNANEVIPAVTISQRLVKSSLNSNSSHNSKLLFNSLMNPSDALALEFTKENDNKIINEEFRCPFS